ncbi:hypothetical protein ACFOKI_06975 [Sphingomonas qilianensis]|uniref:Flagellar FliJ protein n=1 Tax=Sphingomonas qilianensis TaxID=1736690 RepID=A0ABU9XQN3_9SPHN
MKTPFDAAMRVRRREIERAQVVINRQIGQLLQIEQHQAALTARLAQEAAAAAVHHGPSAHAYLARMRQQRLHLAEQRAEADRQLAHMRAAAQAAYGDFKAIESAADAFRDDETRKIANGEQSHLDDVAATAIARLSRRPRA